MTSDRPPPSVPGISRTRRLRRRLEIRLGGPAVLNGILLLLVAYVVLAVAAYLVERGANPEMTSVGSAFYWTLLAIIQNPPFDLLSQAGRVIDVLVNVVNILLVGLIVAWVTQRSIEFIRRRSAGMIDSDMSGHLVICGWSTKGSEILSEIRGRKDQEARRPAVVLAKLSEDPTNDELSSFVAGDPTSMDDLKRAGVERAHTAIVLADRSFPGVDLEDVDSRTLLTVLAIESVNPRCYTCVEVVRSENREHFDRTRADELVISGQLTGALLAHSAVVRGLAGVVTDLITHPEGDEFYSIVVPDDLVGASFAEGLAAIKQRLNCLPVALETEGRLRINPPAEQRLTQGQRVLVISKGAPAGALRRGGD